VSETSDAIQRTASQGEQRGSNGSLVRAGGYAFRLLEAGSNLQVELLRGVDAVIVDCEHATTPLDAVETIRAHTDRAIYLKPVFLLKEKKLGERARRDRNVLHALTDGSVRSLDRLGGAVSTIGDVQAQGANFTRAHSVSFEDQVLTKVLRYLASRDLETVDPLPSRSSKLGYAYPIADVSYSFKREHKALRALDIAEEEGLLAGNFVDAWYVCSNCSESCIHPREVCPECNTSDLEEEDLVHHFRCAYVGPLSDFVDKPNLGELVCPKCERILNHVGVDYDKPSSIFTCRNGHTSQNPPVVAKCFTCGTDTRAERLTKRTFKRFDLTPKGKEKARTGVMANVRELNDLDGVIEFDIFETMLRYEVERARATNHESALVGLHFANASELFSFVGREARADLLAALVRRVQDHFKAADVLAFESFDMLVGLVTSTGADSARRQLDEASETWKREVADAYEGYEAWVASAARPVRSDDAADEQLDRLLTRLTERADAPT
jgi:GGDEF domain-containing protein